MAGLTWKPQTINSKNINTNSNNNDTELHTGDLDLIIAKIAQLKATPQSDNRDSQIQVLVAQRNALLSANKEAWDLVS